MTKKPNFAKCILGVFVLAILFIGTWATTSASLTSAKKSAVSPTALSNSPNLVSRYAAPLAPVSGEDSIFGVFELDGDIFDFPAGLPDDWDTVNCDGGNADVKTGVIHDGSGVSIFTQGGSKDPNDVSAWRWTDGAVPDKDDLLNAYAAKYTGSPNGDTIIAFGADKYDISGTAFIGAWFFQNSVCTAPDGRFRVQQGAVCANSDPLATHSVGDVLVLLNFSSGGTSIAEKKVYRWVGTGGNVPHQPTLDDITGSAPVGSVEGLSNLQTGPQAIPGTCSTDWPHTPKSGPDGTIQTNAFFEGAININAFPGLAGECFNSFLVETRSSDSVTAQLKDFVLGSFNTCPEVSITKTADDTSICAGHETTYTYDVNNPTNFTLTGTVVDDNETPADTSDDLDVTNNCAAIGAGTAQSVSLPPGHTIYTCSRTLGAGSHTNTVTVSASFGGFSTSDTDDETVVVSANPDLLIDNFACNTTGFASTLTVTDANSTGGTLSWTRNGNSFAGDVTSIDVLLPGVYVVTSTTTEGCTDSASRTVGICTTCSP